MPQLLNIDRFNIDWGKFSKLCAGLTGFLGVLVILGWIFNIPQLKTVLPGLASMKFNTALCFFCLGVGLYSLNKAGRIRKICSTFVLLLCTLTLAQYIFNVNFYIDEFVFIDVASSSLPGRMAPATAVNFILLSAGQLLFVQYNFVRLLKVCAAIVLTSSFFAVLGYAYNVKALYTLGAYNSMALHTAVGFLVLSLGTFYFPFAFIGATRKLIGSRLFAFVAPIMLILFFALIWFASALSQNQIFGEPINWIFTVIVGTIVFSLIFWVLARTLNSFEIELQERNKEISEREKKLSLFFSSTNEGIITTDLKGNVITWNPAATRILGYQEDEVLGHPFIKLFPSDPHDGKNVLLETALSSETVGIYEGTCRAKYGELLTVRVSVAHIRDEHGTIVGVARTLRDVTNEKKAESELLRLGSIVESSSDAIIGKDFNGIITSWNSAAESIFGYTAAEIIGSSILKIVPENLHDEERKILQTLRSGKKIQHFETKRVHKDGHLVDVSLAISPIRNPKGEVVGIAKIARDISDLVQAKESLRKLNLDLERKVAERTQQLQNSNTELEQFAYVASHDLKEPLRMIISYIELLEVNLQSALNEKTIKYMKYIKEGAERLQSLIGDLLKYSRVSRTEVTKTEFEFDALVKTILLGLKHQIEEAQAIIRFKSLPKIVANESLIGQVIQNLVLNSIKFHKADVIPEIEISVQDTKNEWLIAVKDNGIGISPDYFDKIFVIFQRLHARDEYPGTGIGLALCKKIVEMHGGKIWVESSEGEGSTFKFSIPKREALQTNFEISRKQINYEPTI